MIKIYLDGASLSDMKRLAGAVDGFTTNPSLMKSAGITDYRKFAAEVLAIADGKPVSFEVLADDAVGMERQARLIDGWGENIWVKIPVITAVGLPCAGFIRSLLDNGLLINATAVMTPLQMQSLSDIPAERQLGLIVSVFAGRIGDAGREPEAFIGVARANCPAAQVLWASTREIANIVHAERAGADIITVSPALFDKMTALKGKDLDQYSRETVQQFVDDAKGISF